MTNIFGFLTHVFGVGQPYAKQKKDAHIAFIKHSSSSREKVEADQFKSFQQKHNVGCAQKASQTNGDGDIRMWVGYANHVML